MGKTVFQKMNERDKVRRKEIRAEEKKYRRRSRQWLWLVAGAVIVFVVLYFHLG
jgi:hypothetical protein